MRDDIWENMISRNSHSAPVLNAMQPAAAYRDGEGETAAAWRDVAFDVDLDAAVARDTWPLPYPGMRENYYQGQDFSYWASGLDDLGRMLRACRDAGLAVKRYLDFGCSSGRVLRHMAVQHPEVASHGCDSDKHYVEWVLRFLPASIVAFQNHSIPTLPLADASIDLVSAFSVFTHIEAFETAWLMELRRILRPGGIAYLTVHTDRTWRELDDSIVLLDLLKTHPDFAALDRSGPMPRDPLVFRFDAGRSYTSHVLVSADRIRTVWGRFFEVLAILPKHSFDQDVAVLRRR